jgi:hypothetical protein
MNINMDTDTDMDMYSDMKWGHELNYLQFEVKEKPA